MAQTRALMKKVLGHRRKSKKCSMIQRLDSKLEQNVGKYRHGEERDEFMEFDRRQSISSTPSGVSADHSNPSNRSGRPATVAEAEERNNNVAGDAGTSSQEDEDLVISQGSLDFQSQDLSSSERSK